MGSVIIPVTNRLALAMVDGHPAELSSPSHETPGCKKPTTVKVVPMHNSSAPAAPQIQTFI